MKNNDSKSTNRLLRVVIALLLRRKENQVLTLRQQIEILNDLNLKPSEIAEILGRTGKYISKELSVIKKCQK